MPSNPKRAGSGASQSFRPDEVVVGLRILEILSRGGDASIVARSAAGRRLWRKFTKMKASIESQKRKAK